MIIVGMLPPWRLAERQAWGREHPWIAGTYFSFMMALGITLLGTLAGFEFKLWQFAVITIVGSVLTPPLLKLGARRGWGERPDAVNHPPSARRPWANASDRMLLWVVGIGIVAGVGQVASLVSDPHHWAADAVLLTIALSLARGAITERRRRAREQSSPS